MTIVIYILNKKKYEAGTVQECKCKYIENASRQKCTYTNITCNLQHSTGTLNLASDAAA